MADFEIKNGKAVIPEGTEMLDAGCFFKAEGLTSVVIPKSVTKINWQTGLACSGVKSIIVEDGNEFFDSRNNCNAIIDTKNNTLLVGCSTTIIPDTVENIGRGAFLHCEELTGITIPNSVKAIEEDAFCGCEGLTNIVIPDSVTYIDDNAFWGCERLKSIAIPDHVTYVGYAAFEKCTGLEIIEIPSTTYLAGKNPSSPFAPPKAPLKDCIALKSIVVRETEGDNNYDACNNCNAIIETETKKLINGCNTTVIPDTVTEIGREAFYGRTGLTCVDLPGSVSIIGEYAFHNCSGLTKVTIPDSVTEIGRSAFEGCTGLTDIVIPDSVTKIGAGAFNKCSGLTNITISNSNSVIEIGFNAFGCTGLTSVVIPESLKEIVSGTFYNCLGLVSVTFPKAIKKIDAKSFEGCTALKTIYVPAKRTDYYKKRLPEELHSLIVELPAEKKAKK